MLFLLLSFIYLCLLVEETALSVSGIALAHVFIRSSSQVLIEPPLGPSTYNKCVLTSYADKLQALLF